ncbi:outer membrane lipoprotein chaperone LolA [Ideonella sp.]|uniref:outer membrane lipoprotein chaperone LolA n=1 Tax=Ideonella sp. TaxID=1929293 RepID=UPI002B4A99E4|nr:outer membrane lipoprotein chaperone LolA [Ideonella sp.]HJV69087.1 outer membrane lipoprotein chaperone LolA [Ideonella sp.]
MNSFRFAVRLAACTALTAASAGAFADAADSLRAFVRDVKSGRSAFTQTVTSPDGKKQKVSSGSFSFARPNRFRFDYAKPYAQAIVSDGQKVWFHDPDLNQVTVRKVADALGSTPVALLTGSSIEKTFELKNQPDQGGLEWVQATPRDTGGTIQWLKAGFKGRTLVAVEIADSFGQRSMLRFDQLETDSALPPETFRFDAPAGADVSEQ